jgi:hypothetical protein
VPRPVQIRASYRDDAAHLLRLEEAVSKDERQSPGWRKQICKQIRELSVRLLQAKIPETGKAEARR